MNTLPVWFPVFRTIPEEEWTELNARVGIQHKPYPSHPPVRPMVSPEGMMNTILTLMQQYVADQSYAQQLQIDQLFPDLAATDAVANQAIADAATAYGFAETNDINRTNDIEALDTRITALENA